MTMKMRGEYSGKRGDGAFELCPAGPQALVCCDVIDHGIVTVRSFDGKGTTETHKVSIRWMSQHRMMDGRRYIVQKRYTLSSHKKSTLRRDLEAWRGKPFTDAQADDFDIDTLIGVNALGSIVHMKKQRGTFAEVVTLMPLVKGMERLAIDSGYVRVKDKTPEPTDAAPVDDAPAEYDDSQPTPDAPPADDDTTPF